MSVLYTPKDVSHMLANSKTEKSKADNLAEKERLGIVEEMMPTYVSSFNKLIENNLNEFKNGSFSFFLFYPAHQHNYKCRPEHIVRGFIDLLISSGWKVKYDETSLENRQITIS